jgi:predicted nucleic acid-binding protein
VISYFDSSVLLAILFEEERREEAYSYWAEAANRVSSILLRIESVVSLRRAYERSKSKLPGNWLSEKTRELDEYLNEADYRIISEKLERSIYLNKDLAKCRALDAIHIATALGYREANNGENINFYTFDTAMHDLAEHFRFKTNKL